MLNHQLAGVMFHSDARLYMDFMGLSNMGACQQEHTNHELCNMQKTMSHYLYRHGYMLSADNSEQQELISAEAYATPKDNVTNDYRRKMLMKFMDAWDNWEKETEELYAAAIAWCTEMQKSDVLYFNKMLADVCDEREQICSMKKRMNIASYNLVDCEEIAKCYTE